MRYFKLDMTDEDNYLLSTVEAKSLDVLLDAEAEAYRTDDRMSPCHGYRTAECISRTADSICWSPGNGGEYTISVYAQDREDLDIWLINQPHTEL